MQDRNFLRADNCPDCLVRAAKPTILPHSGRILRDAKVYPKAGGVGHLVTLDEAGNSVDSKAIVEAEGQLIASRQGRLRDDAL
jgi:hypothetical protein